jgi:chitinase
MRVSTLASAGFMATAANAQLRSIVYFDQWHLSTPDRSQTTGITHVITAFAASTLFNSGQQYTPFMTVDAVRAMFDEGTKVCMAIGGWGDTAGFTVGAATEQSRKTYAANVAAEAERLGYDCVDVDWEYPGGNGQDYMQNPNEGKVGEIQTFPLLLAEIKAAIGEKELSIAVPAKEGDMIAYTAAKVPLINESVDFVNVMTYDIMNRRNAETTHHTSIEGSATAIDLYTERGFPASKLNLGFAFYAKFFTTQAGAECGYEPTGCPVAVLEAPDGSDTGLSGAITFSEPRQWPEGSTDAQMGGQWWWDAETQMYWTWDTVELMARKFDEIVRPKGLGGVFAWSLGEDANDWSHLKAMRDGVAAENARAAP